MLDEVKPAGIPAEVMGFAHKLAEAAKAYGIMTCEATFKVPMSRMRVAELTHTHRGEFKVHYVARDGRGRPCENLSITFESITDVDLMYNKPSHD